MKGSLGILAFFVAGVALGYWGAIPDALLETDYSMYVLYGLMLLVGINIGYDKNAFAALRRNKFKVILVPLATIVGTLIGCALISLFLPRWSLTECLAVGSGFGYYSLSSIFITEYKGTELGTIALVSNIIRELFTLLAAPLLVAWFGKLAPISAGGATTADTTLPVITRYSGTEYVIVAIFHGVVVDLSVPFLVTFFCHL